jgi:hypothetical protein
MKFVVRQKENVKRWIPSKEETAAQIGYMLLLTQDAELAIATLIGTVYPHEKPTWEEVEKLNAKTLGGLIAKLKERVEMPEAFVGLLEGFLKHRNLFVHNLRKQTWFDMSSEEGRDEIWKFLESYSKYLEEVLLVVNAALFKSMEDSGMPETKYHKQLEATGFLGMIKGYYPKSRIAFKRKKS